MGKHLQSIDHKIIRRMRSLKKTRAFTPADFLDLGSRAAVDQALSRNARAGVIRKIGRGLYDVPQNHPLLGRLSPNTDAVVKAVAKRTGATLLPSGANAANQLGLSEQVPMRAIYLTDGRRRRVQVGKQSVLLKHADPRTIHTKRRISAVTIHALRWMGRKHVDNDVLMKLRSNLKPADRVALVQDAPNAPGWIADIFHQLAKDPSH